VALAAAAGLAAPAAAAAGEEREIVPAAGGAPLVRGVEQARVVATGVVERPAAVDLHGWAAELSVEQVLAGAGAAPGGRVRIGWEELARGRPARFRDGERVLVALVPLPGQSLWRKRFPEGGVLAVAEGGHAFLRAPDAASVEGVGAWARLPADAREQTPGVTALARLVAEAAPPLAEAARARLDEIPGLAERLDETGAALLARALADGERPGALRADLARLVGKRRIGALRPALEPLTGAGAPVAAAAWSAIAALDGGVPHERVRALLASSDPEVRAFAVTEAARGAEARRVERMVTEDPAPAVRAAAVRALVDAQGMGAEAIALRGLLDPEPAVRQAAGEAAASLAPAIVPALRHLVEGLVAPQAAAAMGALALAGAEGQTALAELSQSHPDERTRQLALLLLGHDPRGRH
jgi:hypothetical protein